MLSTGEGFRDLGASYLDQIARKRSTTKLVQRPSNLGYDVMLIPKAAEPFSRPVRSISVAVPQQIGSSSSLP